MRALKIVVAVLMLAVAGLAQTASEKTLKLDQVIDRVVEQEAAFMDSLRDYSPYFLDQMISVVTASCVTAYAFYTTAYETVQKFQTSRLSWTIPFVLYGIFRYLYLVHRKELGGSPTDVLLTDRPLLLAVALWALAIVVIVYSAQGLPMPLL